MQRAFVLSFILFLSCWYRQVAESFIDGFTGTFAGSTLTYGYFVTISNLVIGLYCAYLWLSNVILYYKHILAMRLVVVYALATST